MSFYVGLLRDKIARVSNLTNNAEDDWHFNYAYAGSTGKFSLIIEMEMVLMVAPSKKKWC